MTAPSAPTEADTHGADEHLWIEAQVAALRSGRLADLDREGLAEFLADSAARDRRELGSRLRALLALVLKVRHRPSRFSRADALAMLGEQQEIGRMLRLTPSLRRHAPEAMAWAWTGAVQSFAILNGAKASRFPERPTLTLDEALAYEPPEVAAPRAGERRRR